VHLFQRAIKDDACVQIPEAGLYQRQGA
jgi:hypothetical protein